MPWHCGSVGCATHSSADHKCFHWTMARITAPVGGAVKSAFDPNVRIVQGALNRFPENSGGPMPRLTTDGQCGRNTIEAIKRLQRAAGVARPDGRVDPDRRMNYVLATGPTALRDRRQVRCHFFSLALTAVPYDRILSGAQAVYAQYGIQIVAASGKCLALSAADAAKFLKIDSACAWEVTSGEMAELQRLGGSAPATDIVVYYVDRFSDLNLLGCGGHAPNRPACVVAAQASRWDTAHEIGHVLLTSSYSPVHSPDHGNLMFATSSSSASTPVLTANQVAQIKRSPCCKPA
jgi:hypothetical protein